MPVHISVQSQSSSDGEKITVRQLAARKARDTLIKKDDRHFNKIGAKGGKKGGRPFKDPEAARRAANARWRKQV